MEPFTTICTTCGRRLRVRSANLIGQIVSCPKCGGMVQIAGPAETPGEVQPSHPQQISVGPAGEVDSQAITRDSIQGESLHATTLADPQASATGAVFNEADLKQSAADDHAQPPALDGGAVHRDPPGALPAGWQSDRTRRARQIGLIATLSITGIIAAAVAFLFFVQRWKENQSRLAQPPLASAEPDDELAGVPTSQPGTPDTDSGASPEETPADNYATPPDEDVVEVDPEPAGTTGLDTDVPSTDTEQNLAIPNREGAEDGGAAVTTGEPGADTAIPNDLMPQSVLGAVDRDGDRSGEDDSAGEEASTTKPQLPPGLRKYTSLLPVGSDDDPPEEQLQEPLAADQVKLDQPAGEEETGFGPAEPIDVANRLRFELAFEKKNAPLSRWLRVISQITGVPISVDVASLDAAGIAPTQAAQPSTGWNTAEAALRSIAQSAGCTMRKSEAFVVIEADAESVAAGIAPALQADDLLTSAANAEHREALVHLVQRVTRAESVTIDPATNVITVEGETGTPWLAALTLDGLRLARQLPPRLPRDRTQRWLAVDQSFDWPTVQGGQGIAPVDHPQPIIALIGRVAEANDATVVFAWGDLWRHGLTPESTAMPWTTDLAGGEVIDRILEPYQLQVRQMSDDLWWVGSQTLYDRDRAIGLIKVPDQMGNAVIERFVRSIGASSEEELAVALDPSSGYLVAHLPRFLLRQLPALVEPAAGEASKGP